jgi:hypothetical protein
VDYCLISCLLISCFRVVQGRGKSGKVAEKGLLLCCNFSTLSTLVRKDGEEGMDRKVKKTMSSNEEVNATVSRTVTRNVTTNDQTSNSNLSSSVSTQNKYDPLSDHEDTDLVDCQLEEDVEEEEPLAQERKKEKPPPIILHGNFGAKRLIEFCKSSAKNQVLLKCTRNNTIVLTENVEDFKILRRRIKGQQDRRLAYLYVEE